MSGFIIFIGSYLLIFVVLGSCSRRSSANVSPFELSIKYSVSWRLQDEMTEKDSAGFVDSKENK